MKISKEEVLRVAELAHLDLTEGEVTKYQTQLDSILDYIAKLNAVDTSKVEPMTQVAAAGSEGGLNHEFREDVIAPCTIGKEVLERAPDAEGPYFRVPKVIER